jgi:hypothetical protein
LVVETEEVDVAVFSDVLPLGERLIEDVQFWEVFSNDSEDGGFAAADVALDGDEDWPAGHLLAVWAIFN